MSVAIETGWLSTMRRYLVAMALGNLVWEFAHMPLYTLWEPGSPREIVFAALHCTGGDILIALSALVAALFLLGISRWPHMDYRRVALATVLIGIGYTIVSEWLARQLAPTTLRQQSPRTKLRQLWPFRWLAPMQSPWRCSPGSAEHLEGIGTLP